MFENIIGNELVVKRLENELLNNTLPPSILFSGPKYSGKLSLALELARVLSCSEEAEWNCTCRFCQDHRTLQATNLVCLGYRDFLSEIHAAGETYKANNTKAALFLFSRSVKKLLLRFSSVLWENQLNFLNKQASNFEKIKEYLTSLDEDLEFSQKEKQVNNILKIASSLQAVLPSNGITIDQVRNVRNWLFSSSSSDARIVIIENLETSNISVRNSLLKLLEEPPANTYLILLTNNKSTIIHTILSRVRIYSLPERTKDDTAEIITKIFRSREYAKLSLEDYFLRNLGLSGNEILDDAKFFLEKALETNPNSFYFPTELINKYSQANLFLPFMNKLILAISDFIKDRDENGFVFLADKWTKMIYASTVLADEYNANLKNSLEKLFLDMKAG